jgi:outer membrane lipoprotein carrier protein
MKPQFIPVMLFACLASVCYAADDQTHSVHTITQAVDDHYNHLRTLQAEFTEIYHGAGMDRSESGVLLLKKPGKMRWDYRSPKEKLFLSDGKNAWFYVPGERQVQKTSVKKLDDLRSPLSFLLGKTKLEKELRGLSLAPDKQSSQPGNVMLRGIPIRWAERISQVVLEITPGHQIARLLIDEADGSTTDYRLAGQRENLSIPDESFRFVPPSNTEVIEGELNSP